MTTDKPSAVLPSTIRSDEVDRFNRLSATWWNAAGPMRPLHVINGLRLSYVLEQIARHFACRFARPPGELTGLRTADIGCGAGLMCEPLAERGAHVVGVDASAKNIAAARLHADDGRLKIDYRVGEPDAALRDGDALDVLLLLEVVEHVDNLQAFVRQAARHLKPGGLLLVSTINRTPFSFLTAIVAAETIFRVLPRGTHRWAQFVRPDELDARHGPFTVAPLGDALAVDQLQGLVARVGKDRAYRRVTLPRSPSSACRNIPCPSQRTPVMSFCVFQARALHRIESVSARVCGPWARNWRARARPMPPLAPVMRAIAVMVCSKSVRGVEINGGCCHESASRWFGRSGAGRSRPGWSRPGWSRRNAQRCSSGRQRRKSW